MLRKLALLAASFAFITSAQAASLDVTSGTYRLDRTHASIVWKVSHLGLSNYTGQIATFDATIDLDASDVTNSSLSVTIDPTSVVTLFPFPEQEDFDAVLGGDGWLNGGAHPEITFTSTSIEVTGENTAIIRGDLTIAGTTLPFELNAVLNAATQHPMAGVSVIGVSAVGTFDRTQYGMNILAGPIGTEVTIEVEAEFLAE